MEEQELNLNSPGTIVKMQLQPRTVQSLENLVKLTSIENRAQLIAFSIQLTEVIVRKMEAGAKVYFQTKGGDKRFLKIST
jgi:hypothetical protein